MINNEVKKELIVFFIYGVLGLVCLEFFTYIVFFALNMKFYETSSYNIVGVMSKAMINAVPAMVIEIPAYCIGFAFRGKERKSFAINLDKLDDTQKWIYLGLIKKSMKEGPEIVDKNQVPPDLKPG